LNIKYKELYEGLEVEAEKRQIITLVL
jgi:hypothetical protein